MNLHPQMLKRIDRYQRFYQSNSPGDLLISIWPGQVESKPFYDYDFTANGHLKLAKDMADSAAGLLENNLSLDDDSIPVLWPDLGIGVHHAYMFDIPVEFAEITSWAPYPWEHGYPDNFQLTYDSVNPWVKKIREMIGFWLSHPQSSQFMVMSFLHFGPMDMANAIRGNNLFMDFYDHPDELRKLLEQSVEAIAHFEIDLRSLFADDYTALGLPIGTVMAPAGAIYVSEDATDLIGPGLAEEWGLPYSLKLKERFGSLAAHHHTIGMNIHQLIAREAENGLIQLIIDPNCPSYLDQWEEFKEQNGQTAVILSMPPDDIENHLDDLKTMRAIIGTYADTESERLELVKKIREISNIK